MHREHNLARKTPRGWLDRHLQSLLWGVGSEEQASDKLTWQEEDMQVGGKQAWNCLSCK